MPKWIGPRCEVTECFACRKNRCQILKDNKFKRADGSKKPCPFMKTRKEVGRDGAS